MRKRQKKGLIDFAYNSNADTFKWNAVANLDTVYGEKMIDVYLDVFKTANDFSARGVILSKIPGKYKSAKINKVLRQRLLEDPNGSNQDEIAEQLLNNYGTPSDYKIVKDYQPNETEPLWERAIGYELRGFRPKKIESDIITSAILDSLITYTNQSYGYGWLEDDAYKNDLLNYIQRAKDYLTTSDSVHCAIEIQSFQNSATQVHSDSAGSYPKYDSMEDYNNIKPKCLTLIDMLQ